MLPDLGQGLAHHTPRPELVAACTALGLPRYGTREVLAGRVACWVDDGTAVDLRRERTAALMSQFCVEALRGLAGYALVRPRGRRKPELADALAARFVPEPEEALKALGFQVIKPVGEGAFGTVYKVRRPFHGGKLWAAKVVLGDARTHAQEAANLARLWHANILQYFVDFPGPIPVIVTEWCGGGTLKQRLGKGEIYKTLAIAHVAKEVCDALAYLHENGVFHRDLHPSNVLFRRNGELVVADFGLSRRNGARPIVRLYNTWLGDPANASDGSYDIFMLGRMLMSMRRGTTKAWSQSDLPALKVHRDFWDLVRASLDPDPNQRPTAAYFASAVEAEFTPAQLGKGEERLLVAETA